MAEIDWVEAETAPRDFILREEDAAKNMVAKDLTGLTVTLVLRDRTGTLVDTAGDLAVVTPSAGLVRFTPDSTDLIVAKSDYKARFKVVDGGSGVGYFPRGDPDVWRVYQA